METDKDYEFDNEGGLINTKNRKLGLDKIFPILLSHNVIKIILVLIWIIGYIAIAVVTCWYTVAIFSPFYINVLIRIHHHFSLFDAISSSPFQPSLFVVPLSFLYSKANLTLVPSHIKHKEIDISTDNEITIPAKELLYLLFFWLNFFAISNIIE